MEQSPVVNVVKKVLPAVVSIVISKYLTIFEGPFGGLRVGPSGGPRTSPFGPPSRRGGSLFGGPPPRRGGLPSGGASPFGFEQFFAVPKGRKKVKVGGGSGFIVDPSGIILTNRHVVADPQAEYVVVLSNEKKYPIEILARDPINDIAILKIGEKNLPAVELGDSSSLQLGQTAVAIGNALGIFRNTVSTGVVSGLSREITAGDALTGKTARLRGLVQTDAAVNPGNSGGPLVDIEGKAIGINAATVFMAENISFALPINAAKKDLEDLAKYGRIRQPFLGVRYVPISKQFQQRYNLPVGTGALVISEPVPGGGAVIPGGPAHKAGIREGDIILAVGKEKISTKNSLTDLLNKFQVGDQINLKVLRQGREKLLKLILGEKK